MVRDEVAKLLGQIPFLPFTIEMSSGTHYSIPTRDHIYVGPKGSMVVVSNDRGLYNLLPILHITAVRSKEMAQ